MLIEYWIDDALVKRDGCRWTLPVIVGDEETTFCLRVMEGKAYDASEARRLPIRRTNQAGYIIDETARVRLPVLEKIADLSGLRLP